MKTKEIVEKWMKGYEPDTFIPNKHGQYIYRSENGASGLNLVAFFEDLLNDYIEANMCRREGAKWAISQMKQTK